MSDPYRTSASPDIPSGCTLIKYKKEEWQVAFSFDLPAGETYQVMLTISTEKVPVDRNGIYVSSFKPNPPGPGNGLYHLIHSAKDRGYFKFEDEGIPWERFLRYQIVSKKSEMAEIWWKEDDYP